MAKHLDYLWMHFS